MTTRSGCPCIYTKPCHEDCPCVNKYSSRPCLMCATYGSIEQQKFMADRLRLIFVLGTLAYQRHRTDIDSEKFDMESAIVCRELILLEEASQQWHTEQWGKLKRND